MDAAFFLRSHIEDLRLQRDSLDKLIKSLTAILDGVDGNSANDVIIGVLGSPCPHCPDYEEKIKEGRNIEKRAMFLTGPAKR